MLSGKKGYFVGIAVVAVLLAGYPVLLVRLAPDPWVSRKGVPRDFRDVEFFTLGETPIPAPARALRTSEVTREETADRLSFNWEDTKQRWQRSRKGRIPPKFVDDDDQVVSLPGGGRIRVAWAAMGYQPDLDGFPAEEPFAPTMVTVRGDTWEPLDEAAFRRYQEDDLGFTAGRKRGLSTWSAGQFSLDLFFLHDLPDLRAAGSVEVMNLDTMTEVECMTGTSFNSHLPGLLHTRPAVEVFYPARLAAGFDIAYGPFEEARLAVQPESRAKLDEVEIEIVAVERFSSSYSAREIRSTWFQLDPDRAPRTTIVFSLSPPELGRFCDVVLVNRDGDRKTIPLRQADRLSYVSTDTLPGDLEEMILRYRPNQARVVFELPPLRGVPEINRDVDNLFDVTIPHLTATEIFTLERTIATQAGVRFGFPDATFPGDYFPHHYENATLRELLEEYLAHHPDGRRVRLDRDTHHLVVPEPFNLQDYLKGHWKDLRKRAGF